MLLLLDCARKQDRRLDENVGGFWASPDGPGSHTLHGTARSSGRALEYESDTVPLGNRGDEVRMIIFLQSRP